MPQTIASAYPLPDGDLSILVEASEAASLESFLRKKGISCTAPKGVIFRPRRVSRDSMGRLHVEEDVLECEIIVKGTSEDFIRWMEEWITGKLPL